MLRITVCFIFLFVLRPGLAQIEPITPKIWLEYRMDYKPDTSRMDQSFQHDFMLVIEGSKSYFHSTELYRFDSTLMTMAKKMFASGALVNGGNELIKPPAVGFIMEKDANSGKQVVYDRIGKTYYYAEIPLQQQKWKLGTLTMDILGMRAQQATCTFKGRNYEAWFVPNIPIAHGPFKFYGLPGLVVRVADTRGHYVCTLTSIKRNEESASINYSMVRSQEKLSSLDQMKVVREKHEIGLVAQADADGVRLTEENKRMLQQRKVKKLNNPMELEN